MWKRKGRVGDGMEWEGEERGREGMRHDKLADSRTNRGQKIAASTMGHDSHAHNGNSIGSGCRECTDALEAAFSPCISSPAAVA